MRASALAPLTGDAAATFAAGTVLLIADCDCRLSKFGSRSRTGCWKAQTVPPPTNKPPKHTNPTINRLVLLFTIRSRSLSSLVTDDKMFFEVARVNATKTE